MQKNKSILILVHVKPYENNNQKIFVLAKESNVLVFVQRQYLWSRVIWSHMKSYENKKKSIWFDSFLITCYLWKILLVFPWLHMAPTHIETGSFLYGFSPYEFKPYAYDFGPKILPHVCMYFTVVFFYSYVIWDLNIRYLILSSQILIQ